jgi:hypothetical protein
MMVTVDGHKLMKVVRGYKTIKHGIHKTISLLKIRNSVEAEKKLELVLGLIKEIEDSIDGLHDEEDVIVDS